MSKFGRKLWRHINHCLEAVVAHHSLFIFNTTFAIRIATYEAANAEHCALERIHITTEAIERKLFDSSDALGLRYVQPQDGLGAGVVSVVGSEGPAFTRTASLATFLASFLARSRAIISLSLTLSTWWKSLFSSSSEKQR
jgi:hypothetical protein